MEDLSRVPAEPLVADELVHFLQLVAASSCAGLFENVLSCTNEI
jgi:hypothetical protein